MFAFPFFVFKLSLFIVKPYHEIEKQQLIHNFNLTEWKSVRAKITTIYKHSGSRTQANKIILGITYTNEIKNCESYNLIKLPYIMFIGTTKNKGDYVDIAYDPEIDCRIRENAIYLPSKKDHKALKTEAFIQLIILILLLIICVKGFLANSHTKNNVIK